MRLFVSLPIIIFATLSSGCRSAAKLLKADAAPPSGFIEEPETLAPWDERAAFLQQIWFKDRKKHYATRDRFKSIYFKPVRTEFLARKGWWDELNTADRLAYENDVNELARFTKETLDEEFSKDPSKRFRVVQEPQQDTIIYEFAIVELVATKIHVNAIGTALGFVVPGGGIIKRFGTGSIAVEVKAYDGATGELIIAWVDREKDQLSPFSVNEYSWYANARKAVRAWAEQLAEVWRTPDTVRVKDTLPFSLNPF